ncbi:methyltransferase small [Mucilaginibacter paludis DSM 18603]|uniref:tRNA1(Val) (adenine(37)-N6)-methyltransferase n=2 Tax=Mucilaginibacter TaxID=423349 RepID=H1YF68_9SPHI|nr:methyltransferase small [Mucilaginibacter paludis DSM 18603]
MVFRFKQFDVDQSGCAMKINTDGVLLGAMVKADEPHYILDIGTGTGVIALMMAQKFPGAVIDAVELDTAAAQTAGKNFGNSNFSNKLHVHPLGFEEYFNHHPEKKYDLIVANPPFYINSLEAAGDKMNLAKHTDQTFFEVLIKAVSAHLASKGLCWLVLPVATASLVKKLILPYQLYVHHTINIHSFTDVDAHREVVVLGTIPVQSTTERFIIYNSPKVYSKQYQEILKDFFTIF